MSDFQLVSPFQPAGDQPQAIEELATGRERGRRHQTLLGVTGSGKTFTLARAGAPKTHATRSCARAACLATPARG